MNSVYIAIRRGVYRHEVLGAFRTLQDATAAAARALSAERDRYHSADIVCCEIGAEGDEREVGDVYWHHEDKVYAFRASR